ncbi:hypothetical protein HUJ05_007040 [Dendroctonus ponderosae]|nr:hypothetical protein HUJ05_007040 [Dendroctonus ponderosae]
MEANIRQGAEFAPNSLSPFCRDVLVKAEPPDGVVPEQFNIPQFDALVPNVKLERPLNGSVVALFHETRGPNDQRLFSCEQCSFRSKHKVSLLRHIKLHSPEDMQSFKCATCGFATLYRRHMDVHTKVLHGRDGETTKLYK